jgi:hypothetical protein
MTKIKPTPLEIVHFKFGLIAPMLQDTYPDSSVMAYYRRITEKPIIRTDGTPYRYNSGTLQKLIRGLERGSASLNSQ